MAMDSGARVMNGTWGQIWEDGTEIAEVSAFQVKVNKNFDTINICGQMAEDRKLTGVKITGSMTLHKVYSRGADDVEQAMTCARPWWASWTTRTPMAQSGWPCTA